MATQPLAKRCEQAWGWVDREAWGRQRCGRVGGEGEGASAGGSGCGFLSFLTAGRRCCCRPWGRGAGGAGRLALIGRFCRDPPHLLVPPAGRCCLRLVLRGAIATPSGSTSPKPSTRWYADHLHTTAVRPSSSCSLKLHGHRRFGAAATPTPDAMEATAGKRNYAPLFTPTAPRHHGRHTRSHRGALHSQQALSPSPSIALPPQTGAVAASEEEHGAGGTGSTSSAAATSGGGSGGGSSAPPRCSQGRGARSTKRASAYAGESSGRAVAGAAAGAAAGGVVV